MRFFVCCFVDLNIQVCNQGVQALERILANLCHLLIRETQRRQHTFHLIVKKRQMNMDDIDKFVEGKEVKKHLRCFASILNLDHSLLQLPRGEDLVRVLLPEHSLVNGLVQPARVRLLHHRVQNFAQRGLNFL